MQQTERFLLSGNEAIALAASHAGVSLGTGYPGTPSTEILERFADLGGHATWAPNEKVALEVGLGAAYADTRVLVTMKHVGVNVAADPLFTASYTGVTGGLILVSADDPGMASSQNEQDNRRYAEAAGAPMLEPADSQEAYDFLFTALEISERWSIPVLYRVTTRVCHSKTAVTPRSERVAPRNGSFTRDLKSRVMIPGYARPAHRRLREKLDSMAVWNDTDGPNMRIDGDSELGIITGGVSYQHVREAAPDASVLKIGMSYPLPMDTIREFAQSVDRCVVIEELDPWMATLVRADGIRTASGAEVEGKPEMFRFGELNVARVLRILDGDTSPEAAPKPGKPPQLCAGCPHRTVFTALRNLNCIVSGDIGCYSLGVLPPFEAMDTLVCMGASLGVGLGMRRVLPENEARRVVSVIGDSTFMHSGINGLIEMVYNPPSTGHVVLILDNGTTAMTGQQEHPGTGRTLTHERAGKVSFEGVARSLGIPFVEVIDPIKDADEFEPLVARALESGQLAVIVARRDCLLAAGSIREFERKIAQTAEQTSEVCDAATE